MRGPGEEELSGGNSTPVVRVGETVRRATGPWSPAVHGLLRHLEERGFDGAPGFLGLDGRGREVLTFVEGEVGNYPLRSGMWSDAALTAAARLLRRYHDATVGYVLPDGVTWRSPVQTLPPREVVCHNDFAPYNLVFRGDLPWAMIDFDTAAPGPRIWDVAYAAYTFVPLCHEDHARSLGLADPPDAAWRLRLFCDAYGLETGARRGLPETMERRLEALCALMSRSAAEGDPRASTVISEGHLDLYQRDIRHLRAIRRPLRSRL